MTTGEKILELEMELERLSAEISNSALQIHRLRQQIKELKRTEGIAMAEPDAETPITEEPHKPAGLEHFIGLNLIHLVGIVVLVTGISIGVKYAIDRELMGPVTRITLAYVAGISLFILSVRLKTGYRHFSAILFSGSMASVYFTTYAACVYYQFLPFIVAFVIMAALTVYTVIMAVAYDRREIALIGMVGAYGIPFLISQNSDRADLFFAYILLINIGIVVLSFRKSWKLMGQLAMLVTWTLFTAWAVLRYDPERQQITAVVFSVSFYLLFLINALAFRIRRNLLLSYSEIQQVVLNNIALFIVAALLLFNSASWAASWAKSSGLLFIMVAIEAIFAVKLLTVERRLQQALVIQSLIYLLLFILMEWGGLTATLLWIAIAVILFITGVRRKLPWVRLVSVLLLGLTLIKLVIIDSMNFTTVQKIISYIIIGALLLLFSFYYQRLRNSKVDNRADS